MGAGCGGGGDPDPPAYNANVLIDGATKVLTYDYTADGMLTASEVLDSGGGVVLNSASFSYGGSRQLESASQDIASHGAPKVVTYDWDIGVQSVCVLAVCPQEERRKAARSTGPAPR